MFTCCTLAAASRGSSAGTWVSAGRSATPCKEPSACTPRWSNPLCRLLRLQRQPPQVLPWLQQYLCPESDRKSTRLNSSHVKISYAVFCLKKKKIHHKIKITFYHITCN